MPVELVDSSGKPYVAKGPTITGGGRIMEIKGAQQPIVTNVTLAAADTEYSATLPAGTKKFRIWAVSSTRTIPHNAVLRYSFTSLGNGSWAAKQCVPIPAGNYGEEAGLNLQEDLTIYFSSPTGGNAVVVIMAWK